MTRHDYLPFGEELIAGIRRNGSNGQYGYEPPPDGVRQKFTGYERDTETALDYAQARYYSSIQGRFTSPDLPFADQYENDPQSWNLYAYVRNNPCSNNDPSGRKTCYYSNGSMIGCEGDKRINVDPNAGTLTLTLKGHAPIVYNLNRVDAEFKVGSSPRTPQDVIVGLSLLTPGMKSAVEGAAIVAVGIMAAPIIGPANAALVTETLINNESQAPVILGAQSIAPEGFIDPHHVRFSQDSIRNNFSDGRTIDYTANQLRSGRVKASDIPAIRLVEKGGVLYTLDNRRLEAFRRAGVKVPYRMATAAEAAAQGWKFTTRNGGTSIRIRLK